MQIIGPQSILTIEESIVTKSGTRRGRSEIIDQINFYKNLPKSISHFFPQMIDYDCTPNFEYFRYEYIEGEILRDRLINGCFNMSEASTLADSLSVFFSSMHRLDSTTLGTKEYATKQYIHRTENRINELLGCLSVEEKNLYSLVTDNGILFERIIKKVYDFF